jgi:uncharacterized protein (DUF927 family)
MKNKAIKQVKKIEPTSWFVYIVLIAVVLGVIKLSMFIYKRYYSSQPINNESKSSKSVKNKKKHK